MSFIHFKTPYKLNYDKVAFDGTSISLGQLKKLIADKLKFSKLDFDLEITNAETNQVYQNENETILQNSHVNVKRNLKNAGMPIRPQPPKVSPPVSAPAPAPVPAPAPAPISNPPPKQALQTQPVQNVTVPNSSPVPPPAATQAPIQIKQLLKPLQDSLAPLNIPSKPIVYVEEPTKPNESEPDNRSDEKAKLDTFMMNSMTKLSNETNLAKKFLGMTNRFSGQQNQQMINAADRPIPPGYLCVICRKPGHLKQFCPEAGTLPKPEDRPKYPSGIPRTNLRPAQPNEKFAMLGPDGYVVTEIDKVAAKIVKKDKILFDDDEDEKTAEKSTVPEPGEKIPKELQCPFGGHLVKDAVLVPCCGHFVCCDECIKRKIENEEEPIVCPHEKCDQEIGPLVSITPFHETRKKVQEYLKNAKSNESKDPFLALIFDEVTKNELKVSVNGSKSPVQDSNVTSSEKASAEQAQTAANVAANSPKNDEPKATLSPGQIPSVPTKTNIGAPPQFQPRPRPNFNPNFRPNIVPLTNNYSNHAPRPIMHNNFNQMYRPPFQPFDPMSVAMGMPMGPMGPMGGPMMPPNNGYMAQGMMPPQMQHGMYQAPMMAAMMPNPAHGHGIASKEEFYEYQEKLRKEAEMKLKGSYKRSRSRSRSRYSRSRSRSKGRYRSNRYRRSKSRSRSRNKSRDGNYKRYSRSRSRSKRRSHSRDRNGKPRGTRGDSKVKSTREKSRERKMDKAEKRDGSKLNGISDNVVVTIGKSNERQVVSDELDKRKKFESEKEKKESQREKSVDSSSSDRESGKESGDGGKRHKHKHKKSKKKHKRRSSSRH
ncbi:zinc finger CCCH domain-containing 18-like isoform X1 [Brachionus plicatilis]|uniref:Zinc finger CCCH domain-containing 18-like isoform X1 n=1 Tax=Brachionus plicatilis TaxID=10195 RepID=A0A3M7SSM6_BRAPC|nr:zinc finger CCCH domain-containing 18-like isoform X1 [Brachionus plicatilis]